MDWPEEPLQTFNTPSPSGSVLLASPLSDNSQGQRIEEAIWEVFRGVVEGGRVDCYIMWEGLWACQDWDENSNSPLDTFCHLEVRFDVQTCDCSAPIVLVLGRPFGGSRPPRVGTRSPSP
ncbi:hypothetical protein L202_03348 [Cryptococcus amylolentus CBS 6039]|uniref:Uncharacterized protein n=2 Tax=Cryptococcus amylolentus TaxID=104669 RepID=A0A1E3HUZ9_9TREE|nr:hypothetical protein L202_03348 [Cryptococcus amylolentus CBS 6039]ODN79341.1 hypothetical protein L202_03348 [Cryptococcus amylolentus CBS 6039]ODO07734.1 hypothetical protein I350_03309 [Cryptococcus amylolentus CBS 6273]